MPPYRPSMATLATLLLVLGTIVSALTVAPTAYAAPPGKPAIVDCGAGGTIASALASGTKFVTIRGTCNENVTITQDDVTITTDGVVPAAIAAPDHGRPAVVVDAARRMVIDGAVPGITISGGTYGLSALRGASADVKRCAVQGNAVNGIVASFGSTIAIDACVVQGNGTGSTVGNGIVASFGATATVDNSLIQNNTGNGAVASNGASLVVTNTAVSGNTASGLVAVRSSHLRVGQDATGTQMLKAVTVSGNSANGIVITEASAGTVVGGTVTGNAASGIFVGRSSSALIGQGSGPLTAGLVIQNNSHGIYVEGGNATVLGSTLGLNANTGMIITNAGSARIGIRNDSSAYVGNTISNNGSTGILVSISASAFIGGNLISGNGTTVGAGLGRFGLNVSQASAILVGGNTIQNNAAAGVFTRAGSVLIGDPNFGLDTHNTISGNGALDPTNGGVFAFQGGSLSVRNATIANNNGAAVQAFENGIIELRATTVSTNTDAATTSPSPGITGNLGSTIRLRDGSSVVSTGNDGAQIGTLSSLDILSGTTLQGNGGYGVRCTTSSPLTVSAATLTGSLNNVAGTAGQTIGCNLFPAPIAF